MIPQIDWTNARSALLAVAFAVIGLLAWSALARAQTPWTTQDFGDLRIDTMPAWAVLTRVDTVYVCAEAANVPPPDWTKWVVELNTVPSGSSCLRTSVLGGPGAVPLVCRAKDISGALTASGVVATDFGRYALFQIPSVQPPDGSFRLYVVDSQCP